MKGKPNRAKSTKEHAMNRKLVTAGLVAGLSIGAVTDAAACGAALFGTGQGSRFQAYRARVPANVLIYASPELAGGSKATDPAVQDGLSRAGHKVTVVSDQAALTEALKSQRFDVVIASSGDTETVARELDPSASTTRILPVVASAGSGAGSADYAQALRASAGIGQFLKALNKLMEAKLP